MKWLDPKNPNSIVCVCFGTIKKKKKKKNLSDS
ncbi:hypothetical protein NC652_003146 [Populus alba x Populus x berolinensis]|nr:hypothetical protein NC652_003146 [Populus alba x Populus x berolinensis]